MDLFRSDVAACGARIEENLMALCGDASQLTRLDTIARNARTIAVGARILGIDPAIRLAQAIEDAAGAGARGAVAIGDDAVDALLIATSILAGIAAASAHIAGWMVQNGAAVDDAVSAIAISTGVPRREPSRNAGAGEGQDDGGVVKNAVSASERSGSRRIHGASSSNTPAPGVPRRRRGMTVLLVDDQPMIGEAIRQMLAREPGIRLHHCVDPTKALATAAEVQPTVILQDLLMPDVDGLTLVRYFRVFPATRDVPIMVLSTREEPATKAEAFGVGANDYVVKLPDRLELAARVRYMSKGFISQLDSREAWAALLASQEQLEVRNQFIRQIFGRYVSDDIVASLLEKPGALDMGGETRRITIMMTDLRGFTPMCERLEPRQVVAILNTYLAAMTDVILRHGGTINEFIGDAILAVFGAPIRQDDHARRAIACAVEMQATMDEVNARNAELGLPRVEMGIGINTGEVVVGNIGSDRRAKYGVVGRHVNLSSRIESHTIGGQILAAASTIHDAGPGIQIEGEMEIVPKGFAGPMKLHDVRGIGAPYHLYLGSRKAEALVPLAPPVPVRFVVLQGDSASGDLHAAELVSLSSSVGRFRAEHPVAPMENLRVEIRDQKLRGAQFWGKTMARVADARPNDNTFDVWFTSVPDEIRSEFEALMMSSVPAPLKQVG